MLKIGTRVNMHENSGWWKQAYKGGQKYSGTVVANAEGKDPEYPMAFIREPFAYAVSWDHELKGDAQYMYRPSDLVPLVLHNNQEALALLMEED